MGDAQTLRHCRRGSVEKRFRRSQICIAQNAKKQRTSSVGATSIWEPLYAAPNGAIRVCDIGFYKDLAPTEQVFRSAGSGDAA
jgi:hypothetical protein